jgi:hypothetical protein
MSALRRARTVLRSVYRFLFEPQPLADLRGQAGHEMILRPRSRFANRNGKPVEAPPDTNGDDVYELTVAASDGGLSDPQARSVTVMSSFAEVDGLAVVGGSARQAESLPHFQQKTTGPRRAPRPPSPQPRRRNAFPS